METGTLHTESIALSSSFTLPSDGVRSSPMRVVPLLQEAVVVKTPWRKPAVKPRDAGASPLSDADGGERTSPVGARARYIRGEAMLRPAAQLATPFNGRIASAVRGASRPTAGMNTHLAVRGTAARRKVPDSAAVQQVPTETHVHVDHVPQSLGARFEAAADKPAATPAPPQPKRPSEAALRSGAPARRYVVASAQKGHAAVTSKQA